MQFGIVNVDLSDFFEFRKDLFGFPDHRDRHVLRAQKFPSELLGGGRRNRLHAAGVGFVEIRGQSVEVNVLDPLGGAPGVFEAEQVVAYIILALEFELLLRHGFVAEPRDFFEGFLDGFGGNIVAGLGAGLECAGVFAHVKSRVSAVGPTVFFPEVLEEAS